jgi:hypothetical protein
MASTPIGGSGAVSASGVAEPAPALPLPAGRSIGGGAARGGDDEAGQQGPARRSRRAGHGWRSPFHHSPAHVPRARAARQICRRALPPGGGCASVGSVDGARARRPGATAVANAGPGARRARRGDGPAGPDDVRQPRGRGVVAAAVRRRGVARRAAAELEIARVKSPLGGREMALRIPAVSSYACDRAARLARLVGGATYTGSGRHFVKYRDERSPFGYDAVDVGPVPAGAELVVYGDEFVQAYARESTLALPKLLMRLSIRRVPAMPTWRPRSGASCSPRCRGAWPMGSSATCGATASRARAALVAPLGGSVFADAATRAGYLLLRLREVPERIVRLMLDVPGIEVFRPVGASTAGRAGVRPPGGPGVVRVGVPGRSPAPVLAWRSDRRRARARRVRGSRAPHHHRGRRRPRRRAGPAGAGRGRRPAQRQGRADHRDAAPGAGAGAAATGHRHAGARWPRRRGCASWCSRCHRPACAPIAWPPPSAACWCWRRATWTLIPLGELLCEQAPGILVPLGLELVPRVAADVLARALGHEHGVWTVFDRAGQAMRLGDARAGADGAPHPHPRRGADDHHRRPRDAGARRARRGQRRGRSLRAVGQSRTPTPAATARSGCRRDPPRARTASAARPWRWRAGRRRSRPSSASSWSSSSTRWCAAAACTSAGRCRSTCSTSSIRALGRGQRPGRRDRRRPGPGARRAGSCGRRR